MTSRRMGIRNKSTEKSKPIQCKYCIKVLKGEVRLARHILIQHPEHVEDYIKGEA